MANAKFDWQSSQIDNTKRMDIGYENSFAQRGAIYKGTNHMGRKLAYEPQRLYNFELQIVGLDELYTADLPGTGNYGGEINDNNAMIHFGSAAERILVACSSFSVPNTEVGSIEIPHYNNVTKYAGKVTFGDATLKIEQYLGSFTEQIMTSWARCVYDPKTQNIGYKADYAKDVYVIQYDSKGGTPRVWKMENAWPKVMPGADWDYNSTERRQMTYTLACDRCVPDYGIDTRTFGKIENNTINSITSAAISQTGNSDLPYTNAPATGWKYNPMTDKYEGPREGHSLGYTFSNL